MRITKDIDWIAASEEDAVFKEIMQQLVKKQGFKETQNPFTLLSPKGMQVDLLPFVENTGRSLEGLKEVFERGTEGVAFDDGETYQVATVPAIVLLKLIAFDDRPEWRLKDLSDIGAIFNYYFDLFSNDIYENHNDLFGDKELNEISAYVIGRKIKHILGNSTQLKERLVQILTTKQELLVKNLAISMNLPEDSVGLLLTNLLDGIRE